MEDRRPPRSPSSSRKPSFDRGRRPSPPRGGGSQDRDQPRGASGGRDGDGRWQKSRGTFGDGDKRFSRDGRPPSRGRKFGEKDYGPRSRSDQRRPDKRRQEDDRIKITSDAQITDGRFRGRELENTDSPRTAPTPRKLREITFKIIAKRVKAGRFLDLGAGVGTIGIEALSRGAMLATFVERSARGCSFIRKNLAANGVRDGHGEVVEMEILPFLIKAARKKRVWDLAYFDLPHGDEHAEILDRLSRGNAIRPGGLLMVEHASDISHPENLNRLKRWRIITQGDKILSVYERI